MFSQQEFFMNYPWSPRYLIINRLRIFVQIRIFRSTDKKIKIIAHGTCSSALFYTVKLYYSEPGRHLMELKKLQLIVIQF